MNDPRLQAQGLAQLGRQGDSMLMHVNPEEVQGLQSLAQANGTSLTTNPYTGQPEALNLGSMFKSALPIAAGFAFGPAAGAAMGMGATAGGIAAGALTGAGIAAFSDENILQGALFGGLGGMGGGSMAGAAGTVGAGAGNTIAAQNLGVDLTADKLASQALNQATNWGGQASKMAPQAYMDTLTKSVGAPTSQLMSAGGGQGVRGAAGNIPSWMGGGEHMVTNYGQAAVAPSNLNTLVSQPGAVASQMGGGNKLLGYGKMAGIAGMPLIAGYEPPTYGASEGEFEPPYDPHSQLDLSMDTGLRLLANGGDVGFGGGEGDFVAGNFAAGDFAGDDSFGEFSEVTQAGQFDNFDEFNDFANDPVLQFERDNNLFNPEVNQPLPTDTFSPGRFIEGAGDGLSDSIPANIEGQQEARLSDGEFVVPADVVSGIGNGSSDAGSAKLFDMMSKIRKRRTGGTRQPDGVRPSDMSI